MKKRSVKTILGILIILIGVALFATPITNNNIKEDKKIDEIITSINENTISPENDYLMIINIPKINLKKGIYDINNKFNNVNKNIYLHYESKLIDEIDSNIILASHSGNGKNAYFNNINKLNINDEIYIYYKNKKYIYKVNLIYEIEKNGSAVIKKDKNIPSITLITCKKNTKDKQLVIISYLE